MANYESGSGLLLRGIAFEKSRRGGGVLAHYSVLAVAAPRSACVRAAATGLLAATA